MKVFTCINHDIYWPVGGASVIIAKNKRAAKRLLDAALVAKKLKPSSEEPYTLVELDVETSKAHILRDGNY